MQQALIIIAEQAQETIDAAERMKEELDDIINRQREILATLITENKRVVEDAE